MKNFKIQKEILPFAKIFTIFGPTRLGYDAIRGDALNIRLRLMIFDYDPKAEPSWIQVVTFATCSSEKNAEVISFLSEFRDRKAMNAEFSVEGGYKGLGIEAGFAFSGSMSSERTQ